MARCKYIVAAIVLLCSGLNSLAQNISNKGKEFWVGYGHHQFMESGSNSQQMTLYLSTEEQGATVTVTIDSSSALPNVPSTWWRRTYTIPPFTVIDIETTTASSFTASAGSIGAIPKSGAQDARLYTDPPPAGTGGAGIFRKKGIHIESNVQIVAYAHIYGSASSGATMLLPVEAWGYSYVSLNSEQSYASNCYNWMYVVATKDNTVIEVTPSVKTRAQNLTGLQSGVTKTVTLMKGQLYQVIGANLGSDANGNGGTSSDGFNLSGTKVRSLAGPSGECFPIAVFAGSSRTTNPNPSCSSGGGDNDNQQLFPQHAWGKRYLTVPFSGSSTPSSYANCTYKVAVMDASTVVKRNGTVITGIQNGNFYVFTSNTPNLLEADKPIMVTQFMTGGGCLGAGGLGDPEMVVVAPIEQAIKSVGFYRNTKENIGVNYVSLIVPNTGTGLSSLRIDGSNVFDLVVPHPANGQPGLFGRTYSIVVKRWSPSGQAQALIRGDSAFNAITYGLGSVESYAYSAGAFVNNLNYLNGLHNIPDTTNGGNNFNEFTAINTPTKMGILMRYMPSKLTFKFSAWPAAPPPGIVTPLNNGIAPEVTAGVDFVMDPVVNYFVDSPVINGIKYYWYQLPDSFRFNIFGTHNLPVVAESPGIDNCGNKENLMLTFDVKFQPTANFTISHATKCTKDQVTLNGPATAISGATTYNLNQWAWTVKQGTTTISTFNTKDVNMFLPPGTYAITLDAITVHGLVVTPLTQNITVYAAPTVTFNATPDTLCLGQNVVFSQSSSYGGTAPINYYSWNLDDGSPGTAATWTNKNKVYAAFGTYNTYLVVGVSPTCLSDTAREVVVVNSEASTTITPPSGCLPSSGVAQFQAASTAQGGTVITNYSWNFGDPSTGANNTSILQNPTHTFSAPGVYQVILNITTATGCMGADTISVNANIAPALAWSAASNFDTVCQTAAPFSLAFGTVTNGITGAGVYSGPGINAAGMFTPQSAGAGTHTIVYTFTSDSNCIAEIDTTITVSPRPAKPLVTTPVNYCQGAIATPLNATPLPGHTLTWYSDPSLTTVIPGGTPTPSTATAGTIKYYVTQTSSSCQSEADTITVNITASITNNAIAANQTICQGAASAVLTGSGSPTGGTGTYNYQWQSSPDGTTWTDIVGATSATYNAGNVAVTTKYRRNITSGFCSSTSGEVTITVVPALGNNSISASHNVCEGIQPNLLTGSTPTGGDGTINYQWQSSPDGSTWTNIAGATGINYQPAILTATTHFRRVITSGTVCTDNSTAVIVTLNLNANGNITGPTAICANDPSGASITYNATAGTAPFSISYTITNPSGGSNTVNQNNVASGATFLVVPAGSPAGTYTVVLNSITNSNNCIRSTGFTPISITVTAIPVVTVSVSPSATVCEGTAVTFTASGATTYNWGGSNTGATYTVTPAPGNHNYPVTGTTNGCVGNGNGSVTVNPRPAKPTVTSPVTYCQNDPGATPLIANGAAGNTIKWYSDAALTNVIPGTPTPSTATAGTTTYYVTQTGSGCESEAETITVTITPSIANNTVASTQTICAGSTPVITATAATGGTGTYTYQWQSSPDGTTWTNIAGATGADYTAVALTVTTHYRRVIVSGLCTNTSTPITVNVTPSLGNNNITASHNVCEGIQPNQLTGSTPTGGDGSYTYQWQSSPTGGAGSWANIPAAASINYQPPVLAATTHFRRIIASSVCGDTSAPVIVTVIPNANGNITAQDADICQYEAGNIIFNATAGTAPFTIDYTITAPGGATSTSNISVSSGGIVNVVPTGSAAGTYTITLNSITNSNGCIKNTGLNFVTITVTATPVVSIAPVSAVCVGGTVTLTASGATTYTWTANTPGGTLSSNTGTSVTTTPAASGTYNFSVIGVTNGCNSNNPDINVVINPRPVPPTVTSPIDYCQLGAAAPLTGSGAAGNTITWYDNAALTNGVTTAQPPSTNNAGTFTYYVTQTNSFACESTPATITINVAPGLGGNQISAEQTICQGNTPAPLTNTGTITGGNGTYSYQWQVSTDGVNFTNIPGATLPDYSPGVLSDTIWYRRNVTSTLCGSVSNIVRINVFEGLGNYNISAAQTICEATSPANLDGQSPSGPGPFTYTWEQSTDGGATWTTIASSNTEDYQPPVLNATTRYRRKVTNGPCTATSNAIEITVNPLANGNITAVSAICEYEAASITFNATVGTGTFIIQYNITPPGGSATSSGPVSVTNGSTLNVIPTGSAPGVYTIMLTSIQGSNGCIRTAGLNSLNITVNPRPAVTINPVTAICEGESKAITATGASTYVWNPGGLTGNTINVTPAVTTTYQVVGTSLGCESNPATVVLTVNPKPNASFTIADNVICLNETASFTNSSTIDSGNIAALYWDFDNGTLDTTAYTTSPLSQSYTTHRIYNVKLKAISDKGCISDQFILPLSVNPLPVASFDPPAFVCMPNGVATFTNTTTIANGAPMTYTWTFGDPASGAANTSTSTHGSHVYPDSASYNITLVATSAQGCTHQVMQPFNTFFNKPVAKFGVTPDTLCQGIQNAFFDSSFAPGSTIDTRLWTFGDGTTDSAASPTKTYLHPGNYQVLLQVANAQGCTASVSKNIVVYLQPVVDAGPSFIVPVGTTVTFNAQTNSGALSLAWTSPTGGTLNNNTIIRPSYIANQDGVFVLTATGDGNCSATDTLSVKVLRPISIPNAFSPNGDGINDTWGIANLGDYPTAVVEVYNRYGQSVYKQFGYTKAWDGKLNGKDLPVGTYYYIIDPKSGFPRVTGYVVIVR